jgi:hypothetical protein
MTGEVHPPEEKDPLTHPWSAQRQVLSGSDSASQALPAS